MQTPITKQKFQDHIHYSWWKYAALAIIAFVFWSITYTMTAYRPPEEKRVLMGVYAYGQDATARAYMEQVRLTFMPEMEQVEPMYMTPDASYGPIILMTRVAAGDCDIYVLPAAEFQSWADQGSCQALDEMAPGLLSDLEAAGISLSRGRREVNGEKHIYGIPCRDLPAADLVFGAETEDMYICVFHNTGNDEYVFRFLDILVHDLMTEPTTAPAA